MTKAEIRLLMKEKRNSISEEERDQYNTALFQKLSILPGYRNCKNLFTYISFQSEADTMAFISHALHENKKVYVPRVEGKVIQFYEMDSFDTLVRSNYGILEPVIDEEKRFVYQEDMENTKNLMLLPGLAFDHQGNRIGYGAGFYDKYLKKYPDTLFYKVALTYDFQVIDHINASEYDKKADLILTPERVIECR